VTERRGLESRFELVVSNASGSGHSVQKELDLVKAGLLYGDHVSIISPFVTFLNGFMTIDQWNISDIRQFLSNSTPFLRNQERWISQIEAVQRGTDVTEQQRRAVDTFAEQFLDVLREYKSFPGSTVSDGSLDELKTALSSGLVSVRDYLPLASSELVALTIAGILAEETDDTTADSVGESIAGAFIDQLTSELSDGDGYLLLDDRGSQIVNVLAAEGKLEIRRGVESRIKQASAAFQMIGLLPSFPQAKIDEILDIRGEMATSVVRFRSDVIKLTSEFSENYSGPDFADNLRDAWTQVITPALNDIDERVEELKLRTLYLGNQVSLQSSPGLIVMGLGLITGHIPTDVGGVALTQASAGIKSLVDRKRGNRQLSTQPFYFLHNVQNLLSKAQDV
jgi:hypothetical protein